MNGLRMGIAIRLGQLHRHAQRAAARDDRDLVQRVGIGQQRRHDRVSRFVIRAGDALVLAHRHRLALDAHQHLVARRVEIAVADRLAAGARRNQRGLVHEVREVGARESRRAARNRTQIDVRLERHLARVHAENLLAALDIGIADHHLTIEPARAQQRRVEDVVHDWWRRRR